jgi:FdhD protein
MRDRTRDDRFRLVSASSSRDTAEVTHTTVRRRVQRVTIDGPRESPATSRASRLDTLAIEEPLQIMVGGEPYATTMRTPGHDLDLALGFLVSEGAIASPEDVESAARCSNTSRLTSASGGPAVNLVDEADHNAVTVGLRPHVATPDAAKHRHVTSACGVCGTASVEDVRARGRYEVAADMVVVDAAVIAGLPQAMRAAQRVFERTGGLHAAGLFTATGQLLCLREDVGRHNAVDKVVGWAFTHGLLPLTGHIVQVSGRASFELVQKTWLAGAPILAAVSAPSSLAADLADDAGLTLIGFSRDDHFTVYTGAQRIG